MPQFQQNTWVGCLGFGLLSLCLIVGLGYTIQHWLWREDYARFKAVKVGMSKSLVIQMLGEPNLYYEKDTAPANYYVGGYTYKERPIGNAVMIYIGEEPIAYYYLDKNDTVEEVFIGGS